MIRYAEFNNVLSILPLLDDLGYPCQLEELQIRFKKFVNNSGYGVAVSVTNSEILGLFA